MAVTRPAARSPAARTRGAVLLGLALAVLSSRATAMSDKEEMELGKQIYAQVTQTMGVYNDPALQEYVNEVGQRLVQVCDRPKLEYHFTVIDTEDVNAFATFGGYIYVSRGLLPYLSSEAELAAVVGHEIGHVAAHHPAKGQHRSTMANIASIAAAIVTRQPALGELASVAGDAVVKGYGRDMELEADRLGATYLARAGYDPKAMIHVLATLKDQERFEVEVAQREHRTPHLYHGLFADHPDNDTRLQQAVTVTAKVDRPEGTHVEHVAIYYAHLEGLAVGTSRELGMVRGSRVYHAALQFTVAFPSGWAVDNGRDQIAAVSPDKNSTMALRTAPIPPQLADPRSFLVHAVANGSSIQQGAPVDANGLPGYTAVLRNASTPYGTKPMRVTVISYGNLYWVFMGASRSGGMVPDGDRLFLSTAETFRRLKSSELDLAEPNRVRMIASLPGMTMQSLAQDSPLKPYPEQQLRLYNHLYPHGEPTLGQPLKVVR